MNYNRLLEIDCLKSQLEEELKNVLKKNFKGIIFDNEALAFGYRKFIILLDNYKYIVVYYIEYICLKKKYMYKYKKIEV